MSEWTHEGVKISLNERGAFTATIKGKFQSAPSLDAMKKRIDESKRDTFVPFEAYQIGRYSDRSDLKAFTVTGVVKLRTTRYSTRTHSFQCSDNRERDYVNPVTPENTKAANEYLSALKETRRIKDEREKVETKLAAKIAQVTPHNYKSK